jgi:alanine racemase
MAPMTENSTVTVRVDLARVRANAEQIARQAGVALIAVVKADAYGLGARPIAETIGDLVDGFYVFDAVEAMRADLFAITGKRSIALLGESKDAADYLRHHIQPAVWTVEHATMLAKARPVLSVDSGQQRFGCPPTEVAELLKQTSIDEAFTHAITLEQVRNFDSVTAGRCRFRHAAGSALLDQAEAKFDAVRPGLALYRGAVRASARLIEARDGLGPAGYRGFVTPRHGVIRLGYSNGLQSGPCIVNGIRRRVLEVGMQSAFVELGPSDRAGDEVVLLGDGLTETDVAAAWQRSPQEALLRLAGMGIRRYVS